MQELKKCPFCGSRDIELYQTREPAPGFLDRDSGDHVIICRNCRIYITVKIADPVEVWNRRAIE